MKLATWNVNSVLARLPLVLRYLEQERPDVLCIQETKCTDEKFPSAAFTELGYEAASFGQPTYNGVAIISRLELSRVERGLPDDEAGAQSRVISATAAGVRIVNAYFPNGGSVGSDKYGFKLRWMKRLRSYFDSTYDPKEKVLLCGDFNVAPEDRDVHNPKLWEGRILFSKPERAALAHIKEWGFTDCFRAHNQKEREFSWWDYRQGAFRRNLGLRIDHIWASERLGALSTAARIDKETRGWERPSDHAPVVAQFKVKG
jgi:exodeoxyribonuclease-3